MSNTTGKPTEKQLDKQQEKMPDYHINFITKDVALKALLFGMVFYIINSKLMNKLLSCLDNYPWIEKNLIQAIIFALVFYIISVNL